MKRFFLFFIIACGLYTASAQTETIVLDLTKSTTKLAFDKENGAWTDTYNDDVESIESQCFSFMHNSMSDYNTWWGFTASNSANNDRQSNTIKFQFSNMAKGGIALNADGTVMTNSFGAPVVSDTIPYLVAFYSPYMSRRPVQITFTEGKKYEAVGVYVNLNSYAYYSIEYGDGFCRAFTNGDSFTLTFHGVNSDEEEKTVDVSLASYTNGDLTINRGWKYVDLSSLGAVNEIYCTMKSTDSGAYGDNTPSYFCLDKLMVKTTPSSAITAIRVDDTTSIDYNADTQCVNIIGAANAVVYDMLGNMVMHSNQSQFDISELASGIYIICANNKTLKIVK